MRFILYNHVGSGNHGCEALVRTVSCILGENNVILLSDYPEEEKKYGITNLIRVQPLFLSKIKITEKLFLHGYSSM